MRFRDSNIYVSCFCKLEEKIYLSKVGNFSELVCFYDFLFRLDSKINRIKKIMFPSISSFLILNDDC